MLEAVASGVLSSLNLPRMVLATGSGTHGFHVNRAISNLGHWNEWLRLGENGFFAGVLWPGDARWIPFLDYPIEDNEAIKSGQLLAEYLATKFTGAKTLSFASHSMGARVVLETIRNLPNSPHVIKKNSLQTTEARLSVEKRL